MEIIDFFLKVLELIVMMFIIYVFLQELKPNK
jgi:hypothetical protein